MPGAKKDGPRAPLPPPPALDEKGRLQVSGMCFALRGIMELDTALLERELFEREALIENDLSKADYLLYDPGLLLPERDLPEALKYEAEGTLKLLPLPVCRVWLERAAEAESVRAKDRPAVIAHFLSRRGDWAAMRNGASEAVERIFLQEHVFLAEAYYNANDMRSLLLLLDALLAQEAVWTAQGYSDGFYVLELADRFVQRSAEAGRTETTAQLLTYRHDRFSEERIQAAEKAKTDCALGLQTRPPVYWSRGTSHILGAYPQSLSGADSTPIEWLVLRQEKERALLISRFVLERKAFNEERVSSTWEICTLREWLNGPFLRQAFTREERERILRATVPSAQNTRYSTNAGPDTRDRVFLLSSDEAEKYFPTDEDRKGAVTEHTDMPILRLDRQDKYKKDGRYALMWWLRGNSSMQQLAPYVNSAGDLIKSGNYVDYVFFGVRPALWVRLP